MGITMIFYIRWWGKWKAGKAAYKVRFKSLRIFLPVNCSVVVFILKHTFSYVIICLFIYF